ncbi:Six-hairpin glycosidase [Ascodesmis nigricans]|uniref:Mannosyl-oligosaccharide glucosidase n=1 Tax=Ascodesmis nigricans TaxID=341454 RepID=A0A4S2MTG8_9PEZI|nr:Six-hairpin glycosidase [Ascodesmis nigricans]
MVKHGDHEYYTVEEKRLKEDTERTKYWKRWGPYLSERQWGTVREDYSANGDAWRDFSFEQSRSRAYRWGEDGIAGFSDSHALQCISFAFWNEKDDILKERLFGLSNPEGNHGESIKDVHFYVDNTPTHSYMKYLYKYPQRKFPYEELRKVNGERSRDEPEYNMIDTGIFDEDKYWDIFIETCKDTEDEEEILFRVTAYNRGPEPAPLHIIPQVWFRNTWAWGHSENKKPTIEALDEFVAKSSHYKLGERYIQLSPSPGVTSESKDIHPRQIYTDNDTNLKALYDVNNKTEFVKDAFHHHIIDEEKGVINQAKTGTKMGAWYAFDEGDGVAPGACAVVRFKFSRKLENRSIEDESGRTITDVGIDEELFDDMFELRRYEADEFYWRISPLPMTDDLRNIQRQAFAGMLWTKQFYHFVWEQWANGDPAQPPPPPERKTIRNDKWRHMHLDDILSMPDCWEYPFFAAWDTAFHCIPLAMIDPEFAKKQLDVLTREWYMHPNGQIPAYEWNFGDVNPPVHAWATFRVFKIERKMYGREDLDFLERVFQKLLLNFTWWVNRKDSDGNNVFEGGFLGLDNIGIFNRSEPLPTGGTLEQADSTGWMAFYSLNMLNIALELAKHRRIYEDIASKFFEHFIFISDAMTYRNGNEQQSLWDDKDGFYYDAISYGGPHSHKMPVRSLVGLIPLYATSTLEPELIKKFPSFKKRVDWFVEHRADIAERNLSSLTKRGKGDRMLLALVNKDRLKRILQKMLDEDEFLSPYGIRSLSKYHKDHPYSMDVNGVEYKVDYVPGDSNSALFGGNSNWRGPIWLCVNFLLIESLLRFHMFYGNDLKVECPTGSGEYMHLGHVAEELQHRLQHIFARDDDGRRACNAGIDMLDRNANWRELVFFHEFFHGDSGQGLGASHQTGWTGLVAKLIHDTGVNCRLPQTPRTPGTAAFEYFDDVWSRSNKPKPFMSRRHSTRSIDARSDFVADDDERQKDDEKVLEYVNRRLKRAMSISGKSETFDQDDEEFEGQLEEK